MSQKGIKRKALSLQEKLRVIREVESNPNLTRVEVAKQLNMPVTTVNGIMGKKTELISRLGDMSCKAKRKRSGKYEDVEKKLLVWFKQCSALNIPVNGNVLKEMAVEFANGLGVDFNPTNWWLDRFKNRTGLVCKTTCEESRNFNRLDTEEWKNAVLYPVFERYKPCDVFSADELGLFYNLLPNKTYAFHGESFLDENIKIDRVTALIGANMDGSEKLPLLVIGKYRKPRCFKNVKNVPCRYRNNKRALMTCVLFDEYLKGLDSVMGSKNRKIVLFIDSCPAHPQNTEHLCNIKVEFLPENSTTVLQPMDQGIIKILKTYFRKRLVHRLLLHASTETAVPITSFRLSLLNAIYYLVASWKQVSPAFITSCFKKAGFNQNPEVCIKEEDCTDNEKCVVVEEKDCVQDEWNNLKEIFHFNGKFEEFVDVDDGVMPWSVQTIEQLLEEDQHVSESEEEEDATIVPSYSEALNALSTFRAFIDNEPDVPENILKNIREIESFSVTLRKKKKTDFSPCGASFKIEAAPFPLNLDYS